MAKLDNDEARKVASATVVPALDSLTSVSASDQSALITLLACLDNSATRAKACRTLHSLADHLTERPAAHLSLKSLEIPGTTKPIRLILSPAVFSPEQWGRTFAEGLMKTPEMFYGKRVVELGTGSGWISLLLLLRTGVAELLALDINPVAITLARLNCWLNGTTSDGTLVFSQYGVPIINALRFAESDLLGEAFKSNERFDHVIGCIPQVLHPDEAGVEVKSRTSEEDLYDLSNYCFQQGILEDRFGLPLIARALEESQLCLNPGGKVTLVLGGRPGPGAIESMFSRRGFDSKLIWSRRIQQADDTDLASLVRLERTHSIQFHFFMSRDSQQAVSAETAVQLLKKNQDVYHDLLVYQAVTRWETPTTLFVRNLHEMKLDSLRNELDFSRVTEEQVSFLSRFSSDMLTSKAIPYPHERGDSGLRTKLAKFLNLYCHYPITVEQLFVGPERSQLLAMVLNMVTSFGDQVLISQSISSIYSPVTKQMQLSLVQGNDDLSELLQLVDIIQPAVVLIAPSQLSHPSPLTLQALRDHASKNPNRWYLVDDSAHFDISSDLNSNMTIRLAAQLKLPGNLIFMYGLIKNTVSPDLELSFLLNAPSKWIHAFDVGAELTYSRIAYPSQLYYEWLFDDLLSFPFPLQQTQSLDSHENETDSTFSLNFLAAATDPVFNPKPINPEQVGVIRLDYGEMEAPVPDALVKGLFKGFLEESTDRLEQLMIERVCSYFKATRQVDVEPSQIVLSQGVFPLFGALLATLRKRLKRAPIVALPDGSYGPVYAAIKYHGGVEQRIPTDPSKAFLLSADQLDRLDPKPDLLWLTQPNNPSGLYFHSDQIQSIVKTCRDRDIVLLADEIFFLMSDFRLGASTPKYLSFASALNGGASKNVFISDGISKIFAAGGMRCGFMVCPDDVWAQELRASVCLPPRSTLRAWDALYSPFLDSPPHRFVNLVSEKRDIQEYMDTIRKQLSSQRDELIDLLKQYQLDDQIDSPYRGGFFVLAKVADRYEQLAAEARLLVNPEQWARTPGWARICFGLTPHRFQLAKTRLRDFLKNES